MGHTYYQNHVHIVFHTGRRTIRPCDLKRVHAYLAALARENKIQCPVVGGVEDHIHLLGNFPLDKAPADIVRTLKAVASRWLKTTNRCYSGFSWQQGYGYFSVSASIRKDVVHYIANQARHHARETAEQEFERLKRFHETASNEIYIEDAEAYRSVIDACVNDIVYVPRR